MAAASPGHSSLKQFAKLFDRKPGVLRDPAHGKRFDGIVTWERLLSGSVSHHDVLALAKNPEALSLKSADGIKVMDAWNLRHR